MRFPFSVRISGREPKLSIDPSPNMCGYLPCCLGNWWTKPVLKVPGCAPLSRRDAVLGIANKEGAHADDEMTENYRRVLESEPVRFKNGEAVLGPVNVLHLIDTLAEWGAQHAPRISRQIPVRDWPDE